jgi:UDP-galactopyranose mutase
MKKILILGGGISGITLAHYLKQLDEIDITIIEKEKVGGLCVTNEMGGVQYEFGPHICYAAENTSAYDLFHEYLPEFKPIKYFPKQSMDGEIDNLATFPITVANVLKLPKEEQVNAIEELYHVNLDAPDYGNFEKYIISRVGKTMYEYCYKNYNRKQWGLEPSEMDSEWARFRNFYLRSGDYGMFGNQWQGHPGTYNPFFDRLSKGIKVVKDEVMNIVYENGRIKEVITANGRYCADIVVSTLPIDFILNREDELDYRGITKLFYLLDGKSGLPTYLCTFPNNYRWTRITDYVLQAEQQTDNTVISFAIPHASTEKRLDIDAWQYEAEKFIKEKLHKRIISKTVMNYDYVYPISSGKMLEKYSELIDKVAEISNLITFGRLGLYSYISMCTATNQAARVAEVLPRFEELNKEQRLQFYGKLREKLS